jgi:hypothetical protein
MADQICKLQPHRTMHLQGFDGYGAAAALWGASDGGFSVSGVFRDQADFAVVVLFEADDEFDHPRWKYLPDWNFAGIALAFDIQTTGLQSLESKKYPWTDWAYLNCLDGSGVEHQTLLSSLATGPGGRTGASTTLTLHTVLAPAVWDRVTLWYQNKAFDYIATGTEGLSDCIQAMWWQGNATYVHSVTIGGATYSCVEGTLSSAQIAFNIVGQILASDPNCTAAVGLGGNANVITVGLLPGVAGPVAVSSSDGSAGATLNNGCASICSNIAAQINAIDWVANGPVVLSAAAVANQIIITAEPGADGNMVTFYELHKNANLYFTPASAQLAGGSSDSVTFHVAVNFSTLVWTSIQKLWLTFAPALTNGAAYVATEWTATVTNWTVTGTRALKVAGPGSVRIEETNSWVGRSGYWEVAPADGFAFWSEGRAIRSAYSASETRKLTIETHCQSTHDIYVGTRLDGNCGIISAALDGGTPITLDCYGAGVQVRRKLFSGVAAGQHSVVLTVTSGKNAASMGWYFYFDFLECAVLSDVPDAPQVRTDTAVATDYDTDATYKMSPQRLLWGIQKSGLVGEIDHYAGVFWWKQAARVGGSFPSATVTFGGTWADGDVVWLGIGSSNLGKSVFPADTSSTIAAHFADFINATLVGVWASAAGAVLTITTRSTGANWLYALSPAAWSASVTYASGQCANVGGSEYQSRAAANLNNPPASSPTWWLKLSTAGTLSVTGDLQTGAAEGTWTIDPTASQTLNRAFRDWHSDYFAALHAAGIGAVVSFSQELVNPPDVPPGAVWVQRYPDGTPVQTATGFGSLYSSQAAFGTAVQTYMASAYAKVAALMVAASLTPRLQFGEVLWWYQANTAGMGFYDVDTAAAALSALGRALVTFHAPGDDPAVNSHADANFLRARLKTYVDAVRTAVLASCGTAVFELLWPMDVDDPDTCRLMRYINLPIEWQARSGSGFDTFVCEGFQYDGIDHNVDKATRCAKYPFTELSWDKAHSRYLMGWFYSGWPWAVEYRKARNAGLPLIKAWAWDHLCLYGWPLPLPANVARAQVF